MRTLYLLRHGEAEPKGLGGGDFDRPLAAAGRLAAERVGAHLARRSEPPTRVLCSSARRAAETLEAVRPFLPPGVEVDCERGLYLAGSGEIHRLIRALDDAHPAVLVVGHAPGIGQLAHDLARPGGRDARARLRRSFPPGALADLDFAVDHWREVGGGLGELRAFICPTRPAASTR